MAATGNTHVHCWVGLDPVEMGKKGGKAAEKLRIPGVVLRAEPATWNMHGHVRQIITNFSGPLLSLRVVGATHCDPENPTDWKGELACGKTDPARRAVFERYTLAALRAVFLGDRQALDSLKAATNDTRVGEVTIRKIEEFKPMPVF